MRRGRRRLLARASSFTAIVIAGAFASTAIANATPAHSTKANPAADIYAPWIVPGASGSAGGQSSGSGGLARAGQVTGPGGELIPVSVIFAARELPATVANHHLPAQIRDLPRATQGSMANRLPPVSYVAASSYLSNNSDPGAAINWSLLALAVAGLGLVLRPRRERRR